jgi:dolichyl-diphosphooligosaccharide--protein glycosyltransferase
MKIKEVLSKESIVSGVKRLGKLRIKVSHSALLTISALSLVLFIAFTIRILPLRWEIEAGSVHLSEFDSYFYYHLTQYMLKNGLISYAWPTQWIDKQSWYPNGMNYATAAYPGLPLTGAVLYEIVTTLGVNVPLMEFLALLMPVFGTLACLVTYLLGKDIGGRAVGLLAALFVGLEPTFIERSGLGWYKHEPIGVFSLVLLSFLFLRSIEDDRPINSVIKYALGSGIVYGYLIAVWGASYYATDLIVLFTFVLLLLKRYTRRLFLSYSLTFGIGLFGAIIIPRFTVDYLSTSVILPCAGVFALLCLVEVFRTQPSTRLRATTIIAFLCVLVGGFAVLWGLGLLGAVAGKFISVLDPFLRAASPILESVAEHRLSAWGNIYYEFGIAILFFIVGFYFIVKDLNNKNLFLLVFGLTSLYFAASMVRLFVILAPAYGLLAAIGIVGLLKPFATLLKETPKIGFKKKYITAHVGKEYSGVAVFLIFLVLMSDLAFSPTSSGIPNVYSEAYTPVTITAGSMSIVPAAPVREWLDMLQYLSSLRQSSSTVVCAWWDYGYWLTVLGNVTTLCDNATIDTKKIEDVGFIFMGNETESVAMLKHYNASYILVFVTFDYTGTMQDWAGGDNGKWTWMARISGGARQRFIQEGYVDESNSWSDETKFGNVSSSGAWAWNSFGMNSTVYKLMFWAKHEWCVTNGVTDPNAANVTQPIYFNEAFFSGKTLSPTDAETEYGGIVPVVALYSINYTLYDAQHPGQ